MVQVENKKGNLLGYIMLFTLDVTSVVLFACILTIATPTPALAYVDPSVMTYTIQAVAGVAVALSAVLGIAFRRSRKYILKVFHMEEKQDIEPPVSRIEASEKASVDAEFKAVLDSKTKRSTNKEDDYRPRWMQRILPAFSVALFTVFTYMIVAPFELISGNEASLVFGLTSTWRIFVLPAVLATIVLAGVISVFRGRLFNAVLMLVFGFALASYVQVLVLNGTLPSSDGGTVNWTQYASWACGTTAIWVVIVVLPLIFSHRSKILARRIATGISLVLVLVQAVGVGSLFVNHIPGTTTSNGTPQYTLTEKGLFTVSPKKNVVIFVLDMYDETMDLRSAVEKNPELLHEMTGFTWFHNTSAVITPTRDAIPSMLTGYQPQHDDTYGTLNQNRFAQGTYLPDFKNAGYHVGVYSEGVSPNEEYVYNNAYNASKEADSLEEGNSSLNSLGTLRAMYKTALFRDLPWVFKPFFWFYTDDINAAMVHQDDGTTNAADSVPYSTNDPLFARKLRDRGLTATDDASTGSVRFIHLMGPHYPYTMDENEQRVGSSTREQQAVGSMNIVSDYIRELKRLGLYEKTTIVITSDHGYFASSEPLSLLKTAATPILLVKPAQTAEQAAQPLKESDQPVSNADVFPTALASEGLSPTYQGVGTNALALNDYNRVRYFDALSKDTQGVEHGVVEYKIVGDAADISNWEPTGWVFHYPEGVWRQDGLTY